MGTWMRTISASKESVCLSGWFFWRQIQYIFKRWILL